MLKALPLLLLPAAATGQDFVSQAPQLRTVLLEQFSAIHCGNCPAAHVLAEQLLDAHPGQVYTAELHGGGLSVPDIGEPDLRNAASTALWDFYGVTSQPKGLVDRRSYSGQTVLNTSAWADATAAALLLPSPVNIGVSAQFDAGTRVLTLDAAMYYTADGTGGSDRVHVCMTESHIVGYQQDYINGPQAAYDHMHVLRGYVTDLWGDEVTPNNAGTAVARSYSFTVPVEWDIANCAVIAFVGEYQGEIYQVREVPADGGSTAAVEDAAFTGASPAFPNPAARLVFLPRHDGHAAEVQLIDGAGRVVRELRQTAGTGPIAVDVHDLPAGMYSYRVVGPAGVGSGRLVVLH